MKRIPLNNTMTLETTITIMAEGNSHAQKLLQVCADTEPVLLLHLDDMNVRGVQAWNGFYWFSEGKFDKFRAAVVTRDKNMIDFINQYPTYERAVQRGGAPR